MKAADRALQALLQSGPVVRICVSKAKGSTPRAAGTWMLVATDGIWGTIGGGQLEFMAIDHARRVLSGKEERHELAVPLGPGIGQCCGGHVTLGFSPVLPLDHDQFLGEVAQAKQSWPHIYVFGAGHVGRALARGLQDLPYLSFVVDTRADELALVDADVRTLVTPVPEAIIKGAPPGSSFVAVTHDHALDFMITGAALARGDAAYVGMIGSATKRTQFKRWAAAEYGTALSLAKLICPIGGQNVVDKRPEIIAALTIAELIGKIDQHCSSKPAKMAGQVANTGGAHG